ncbi:MAG: Extracellular solute binding protein [Cenarchaeum symbiont of Oopsacas minuta]|nr:Extracellular solute binding protein [Cenarchaeum symbiont of Oopsacas minuta]
MKLDITKRSYNSDKNLISQNPYTPLKNRVCMRMLLLLCISSLFVTPIIFAEKGTNLDSVEFVQYLDENTALEEIKIGNLDAYYFRIPAERLQEPSDRDDLHVFESPGGFYSILVNPAESETFNPFSIQEIRYALNYLVDRKLIVNELMGGYGTVLVSNYGPHNADYMRILDEIQSINFQYDPQLAEKMIRLAMVDAGAIIHDGVWRYDDKDIVLRIFIRSDDQIRKSMGEILASDLEKIGFLVQRDYGDLNKAFVTVYGSDPAKLDWSLYTEGWGAPTALVKYDQIGLAQMYSPWFSNMPGFNNPEYWNYENVQLDNVTQAIYAGNFTSESERAALMRTATREGVQEAIRIFVAAKNDLYVASERVDGLVNDFGAGISTRLSLINAITDSGEMRVGVKQIYQGSWNPVMGFTDYYSSYIWSVLSDPASFRHPYTGDILPLRTSWSVETAGLESTLDVPLDAMYWDVHNQKWTNVDFDTNATSKVTLDYVFGNWHHGRSVDMADVLYDLYFVYEWGHDGGSDDAKKDSEFTARTAPYVQTLKGIRQIDDDTLEVYVDYWHFDDSEIAAWATIWPTIPWEMNAAMEKLVTDGKASFSKSGATSHNTKWISMIIPNDAYLIKEYLQDFIKSEFLHPSLTTYGAEYRIDRYNASKQWITDNRHALVSNGPYRLDEYAPESRTIRISSYDGIYPFTVQEMGEFKEEMAPKIVDVIWSQIIMRGKPAEITIHTENADTIRYYMIDAQSNVVKIGNISVESSLSVIHLDETITSSLVDGAGDIVLFALSESILRSASHTVNFLVVNSASVLPSGESTNVVYRDDSFKYLWLFFIIAVAAMTFIVYTIVQKKRSSCISKSNIS